MRGWRLVGSVCCGLGAACAALLALALARSPRAHDALPVPEPRVASGAALDPDVLRAALAAPVQMIDEPWEQKPLPGLGISPSTGLSDLAPARLASGSRQVPEPGLLTLLLGAGLAQLAAARAWRRKRR